MSLKIICFLFCSDLEGSKDGDKKKKEKPKAKRKKVPEKQMPRLSIFNIEQDGEVVECQLETAKHSSITFKFNMEDDQPSEIAENLVRAIPFEKLVEGVSGARLKKCRRVV